MPKIMPPCDKCEKKGCGAYHDECPEYLGYRNKISNARKAEIANQPRLPTNPYLLKREKEMKRRGRRL